MKWTVYGGRRTRAPFGSRILLVSCLFLLASLIFATVSKQQQSNYVYAAENNQKKVAVQEEAPTPLMLPTAAPETIKSTDAQNAELTALLAQWAKGQPNSQQWGIAVRGVAATDIAASYQADVRFESASIYKLYMTYALSKLVPTDQWSHKVPKDGRTYSQCVTAMMQLSDNKCGEAIGNSLGWSRAQRIVAASGYTGANLNTAPPTTTPADTTQFLADLYVGKNVTPDVREQMLTAMQKSAFRQGIVAGCSDCNVANKTGNLNGYNHDAAIVQANGKVFVLTIFSKGGSMKQIADITQRVQTYIHGN